MPSSQLALLAADTDRTQAYVFESSRLPEIRGASRQLDDLNDQIAGWVRTEGGQLIFWGGGSLLATIPPDRAETLARRIEAYYPTQTGTATITADWRPITDEMWQLGYPPNPQAPFASLMEWATTWLRRRKEGRRLTPWVDLLPHTERCRSCHTRAADPYHTAAFPDYPLCKVCHDKRAYIGRNRWFRDFQDFLSQQTDLSAGYYQTLTPFPAFDRDQDIERWTPQDLSELGQACRARPGVVGFIYLDGDSIGQVFSRVATAQQASVLSDAIYEVARDATMRALAMHLHPCSIDPSPARQELGEFTQDPLSIHPFEIITVGGDDIMLIVPADKAIAIASAICLAFQDGMRTALNQQQLPAEIANHPYTLSGGVVLADDDNPVRFLRDLASELKKSAKRARHEARATEGYLDFAVLFGTDVPDRKLGKSRQLYPYLIEQSGRAPRSLLGRPYPVSRLQAAWQELVQLKADRFPNSQMTLLMESLLAGVEESGLFYQYQRMRSHSKFDHLDAAIALLSDNANNRGHQTPNIWQILPPPAAVSFQTVLWDIAELYSVVAAKEIP